MRAECARGAGQSDVHLFRRTHPYYTKTAPQSYGDRDGQFKSRPVPGSAASRLFALFDSRVLKTEIHVISQYTAVYQR